MSFYSDTGRIKQVLMNLISNAYKFTNQGGITLKISLMPRRLDSNQNSLKFEVHDTGIGISQKDSENLFQMFAMVNKHRNDMNMRGTGLGLTISQKLVNRLGGDITLESQVNMGTKVTFTVLEGIQRIEEEKYGSPAIRGKV